MRQALVIIALSVAALRLIVPVHLHVLGSTVSCGLPPQAVFTGPGMFTDPAGSPGSADSAAGLASECRSEGRDALLQAGLGAAALVSIAVNLPVVLDRRRG